MRHRLWFVVQLMATLLLLALLVRRFDWTAFRMVLGRLSPAFYVGSLAAVVAGHLLYAFRWQVVLRGMGIPVAYPEIVRQYLVGLFFGNLMPTAVGGDAARVYYLGRQTGFVQVGASVLVDRFLGFLWLSVLGAALAWLVAAPSPLFVLNRSLLTMFAVAFLIVLAVVWLLPVERALPARLRAGRLAPLAARVAEVLGPVRGGGCRPATLVTSAGVVLAYQVLMTIVYEWFFAAVHGTVPLALTVLNVLVSMSIFVNVPISINGIGLREQLHAQLFESLGVTREVAVSVSLLVFSHSLVLSLVGYGVWLRARPAPSGSPA